MNEQLTLKYHLPSVVIEGSWLACVELHWHIGAGRLLDILILKLVALHRLGICKVIVYVWIVHIIFTCKKNLIFHIKGDRCPTGPALSYKTLG